MNETKRRRLPMSLVRNERRIVRGARHHICYSPQAENAKTIHARDYTT
jgi:hypothetical protein